MRTTDLIDLSCNTINEDVSMTGADEYGRRYTMDAHVVLGSRGTIVRRAWIIKTGEDFPRLVSCYVLRGDA
jgi:hypothetical protein